MAPSPRKPGGAQAYPSEVSFAQLRTCLVNLPGPLVSLLDDANIVAQNIVVELTWRQNPPQSASPKKDAKPVQRSVYVGWSGMQSKTKPTPVDAASARTGRERETPLVEVDATFAKVIGLSEGQRVGILLLNDPPQVHTVNIEPVTPADWEVIELHASFLEINFLAQVRALPNPAFKSATHTASQPLTLHLSPTLSANVMVSSISPAVAPTSSYAKIGANAEVIVAPKVRQRFNADEDGRETRSIGAKSGASTANTKSRRSDIPSKPAVFRRGLDRRIADEWFDNSEEIDRDTGLRIWADWSVLASPNLRGVSWVWVSIARPAGLQAAATAAAEEDTEAIKQASRVIAQVCPWEEAPDANHMALSSQLCSVLECQGMVGETVRIEAAPPQASKQAVRTLRIVPFAASSDKKDGFRFGGKSKADAAEAAQRILAMYGSARGGNGMLDGPLTDGMILPPLENAEADHSWQGGVLKLHPLPGPPLDAAKTTRGWLLGAERKILAASPGDSASQKPAGSDRRLVVEVMAEIPRTPSAGSKWTLGEPIPAAEPHMVGIDPLIATLTSHLLHSSSTLLTGGVGSGKTTLAHLLSHRLRKSSLFNITYYPCRLLVTEETRIPMIRDTLNRVFGLAAWRARAGGKALVILDDLDKLCPVETELEVGGENGRNKHISETVMSIVKQHCTLGSRVVLLATAQAKEAVHNTIIGGHVVREIIHLHAPDKETRRKVLESLSHQKPLENGQASAAEEPQSPSKQDKKNRLAATGFQIDSNIDFLDLAGRTDGHMPGDLALLVSRARSEALVRTLAASFPSNPIVIYTDDFTAALKGFTPSSLRNVTLQHSSTTFSSIGGLRETRQILLETLQYPTLYAPIFARCPLRLRSGLLLYGFPGCGKTLLASAVAGECGLNFISVKGPEILNKYIGASEKSVRDLFERAQAARPCVLFFDEFDSVAPKRGHDSTGVTDRVVNQLLTQMDGAEGLSGVYVLAATSRPDLIDPALLRPGRLDKSLLCDMPSADDRLDILRALSTQLRVSPAVLQTAGPAAGTLREVARRTPGYTGADLQAVIYNAHLEAIHDVLGDSRNGSGRIASSSESKSNVKVPDFSYFRYGDALNGDTTTATTAPQSAAQQAAERGRIAQQLVAHRMAQSRARALRRGSSSSSTGLAHDASNKSRQDEPAAAAATNEPTIEWSHLERALATTRASMSVQEVHRLGQIYREFVVGRNGDLPDGQGGSEIGGRTSLM